ncbi:MAG: helix-turn-helix transcriptional regulator [Pseudomonadota bacterium]
MPPRRRSHVRNHVRALRERHEGMTQQQLADALGVSRQTVIAIERGKFCPSLESALRIARLFEAPVEQVFELEAD